MTTPTAPHRSIATVYLSGTLEDRVTAAAAAGFDGIEVFEPDLIGSPWHRPSSPPAAPTSA